MAAVHTNNYKNPASSRYKNLNDREKDVVAVLPHLLESYHYIYKQQFVDVIRESGDKIFLDSGAFSAHTLGAVIDLPTYCRYIQENIDIIRHDNGSVMASVLDGIGDAQKTYSNQLEMEYYGVRPLPCFHFGEDPRYLDWYVQNYDYITIGGMVGKSSKVLIEWLDRIWEKHLVDSSGTPKLKVHAFGITAIPIMERYPWYSVDSSSWIQSAAFGGVITKHGNLSISAQSPNRHNANQHISSMAPDIKSAIEAELELSGFNYERLSTVYESRAAYNLYSFCELNKQINKGKDTLFLPAKQELF